MTLTVIACAKNAPTVPCDLLGVPAIAVHIVDATSLKAMNHGATVLFSKGGAVVDSVTWTGADSVDIEAFKGTGTYDVAVRKSGYQSWSRSGIVVSADPTNACHPQTVSLTAAMVAGATRLRL
jgi:hypothetical protein